MATTITTRTSWGKRLGGSVKGILVGLIIFIASFPLLFWNEGRAVTRHKSLEEGADSVIEVSSDKVDSGNDGKLVHMSGEATTEDTLSDAEFGVSEKAIKLKRNVEMYQWVENTESSTDKKLGGAEETTTTYTYEKEWSSSLVDSSTFQEAGHENPETMQYQSDELVADNVKLGEYKLSSGLIGSINQYEALPITQNNSEIQDPQLEIANNGYYLGFSANSPEIGDLRINFEIIRPLDISIVSEQNGDSFVPYKAEAGDSIELLEIGTVNADQMFESAIQGNRMMTWFIRIAGFFVMFIGLSMILKPLSVLGDVVPFIGSIIGAATGLVAGILSLIFSLITIAIAWLFYRPLIGGSILILAVVGGYFAFKWLKSKKAPAPKK